MLLSRNGKRILDCIHLLAASVWLGAFAVIAFFVIGSQLGWLELKPTDALAAATTVQIALVKPLIPLIMLTGVIYGATTKWGFVKIPWVCIKWLLSTALVISIPLLQLKAGCLLMQLALLVSLFTISVLKPSFLNLRELFGASES